MSGGYKALYTCNYLNGAFCGGEAYSTTSLRTVVDGTGVITSAPNELLLNNATLSTQSVTVGPQWNYLLRFYGTGSITLSGAATGTLSGTGVGNQVFLKITAPTSGSLTLTVSGSVTSAFLSAVTYETTPSQRRPDEQLITSAAYYGPALPDYNPATLASLGYRSEAAATNTQINSNNMALWSTISNGAISSVTPAFLGVPVYALFTGNGTGGSQSAVEGTARAIQSNGVWSLSADIIPGTRRYVQLWEAGNGDISWITIDTTNWTITETGGANYTSSRLVTLLNGGARFEMVINSTNGATGTGGGFGVAGSDSATPGMAQPTCVGNHLTFGATDFNTVKASSSSSGINTGASSVTRAADVVTLAGLLAALKVTNPIIVERQSEATNAISRTFYAKNTFAFATGYWYRQLVACPATEPTAALNAIVAGSGALHC
jgi:hypothetical protein